MSPKKRKDPRLPPYVTKGTSAYLYIPYVKGVKRRSYRLCALDAPLSTIWAAYERRLEGERKDNLRWLLNAYRSSTGFTTYRGEPKAPNTIAEHSSQIDLICAYPVSGESFGDMKLSSITPGTIRLFLDWRMENGGRVAGNREVEIISRAWNWARTRDHVTLSNPCTGVERNPEPARQHYVEDRDYYGWLKYVAENNTPMYLYVVTEICYLCRVRKIEVLTAKRKQILDEGFDTLRRKRSRDGITAWSPRLRYSIDLAQKNPRATKSNPDNSVGRFSQWLVTSDAGKRITVRGFNSAWQRHMPIAVDLGYVENRFTLHDLKRKGASDSEQDATVTTGNSSAMTRVYDVSKLKAKPTK